MKHQFAQDLLNGNPNGAEVEFHGWVKARRRHNHTVFLDVSDSTGTIQVVLNQASIGESNFSVAKHVSAESAVKITGTLRATGKPIPSMEIQAVSVEVTGPATMNISPHPRSEIDIFDPKLQEQLLDKRHFYLRNEKIAAILRFRHVLTRIVHRWFDENGFMEIHAPILTPTGKCPFARQS